MNKKMIFLFSLIFSFTVYGQSSFIVRMGTKVDWPPYHLNLAEGSDGLAVRAFACIMVRINQPFVIDKKPWKRVQHETKSGKLDGFFSASQNNERDSYATQSKVFLPQERRFYSLKNKINIPVEKYTIEYIKNNLDVGARSGSNALKSLQKDNFRITLTPHSQEQFLKILDLGRVHAILENSLVFNELLKISGRSIDEYHNAVLEKKNMGVYFSHQFLQNKQNFMEVFNKNIKPCSLLPDEN